MSPPSPPFRFSLQAVQGLVERLLEQRERWGFSHYTVRPEALGQLEPVLAALAGR